MTQNGAKPHRELARRDAGDTALGARDTRPIQLTRVRRDGWTKAARQTFLDTLAATCNVRLAFAAAGRSKSVYLLRKRDPAFAALWREALALGYERLETALLEQALGAVNAIDIEPVDLDPLAVGEPTGSGDGLIADGRAAPDRTGRSRDAAGNFVADAGYRPADPARLQFALRLLDRHRAEVEGNRKLPKGRRRATAAETDALLRAKLDQVAKRLALKAAVGAASDTGEVDHA